MSVLDEPVVSVQGNRAFAAAFAGSPAGMLLTRSSDGVIVEVNRRLLEMTGYPREHLVGHDAVAALLSSPIQLALRDEVYRTGKLPPTELELRCFDGRLLTVVATTETIELDAAHHRLTILTDITAQKLAEHRLLVRQDVGRELIEGHDFATSSPRILQTLCRGDSWEAGGIYLVGDDGLLRCATFWHEPAVPCDQLAADTRGIALAPGYGLLGRVVETGQPAGMPVSDADLLRRASAQACGLAYVFAFPILHGDRVLGVFEMLGTQVRSQDPTALVHYAAVSQKLGLYVERVRAEERQVASEARLRTVIDALTEGLLIADRHGVILHANRQVVRMLEMGSADVLARLATDFAKTFRVRTLDGAVLTFDEWPLSRVLRGESVQDEELWLERLDRDWRRVIRYGGTLVDQADGSRVAVLTMADVTDQVMTTRALHQVEERFQLLTENIDEVFYITDPAKNVIEYVSPGFERAWGRTCAGLVAAPRSWIDGIHPDDRPRIVAALPSQAVGTYHEEFRILRPDGSVRWIRDHAFPVRDAAGGVVRVVGIARDVTDERELREQFQQSQKLDGIGQLAGGVAHDFNNILSVMLINLDLLRPYTTDPHAAVLVQEASDAGRRAAALTRQLLLFSRRETMTMRSVDLNEVARGMMQMLARMLGERVVIQLELATAPLTVTADLNMLEQVLLNLAINARDAMSGGGTLAFTTEQVGPDAILRVTDTGCGIPESIRPRIWDPFFTTKPVGTGTGLGLSTVYGIAKQHGGWVSCDSEVGRGSTFSVGIPCNETSATSVQPSNQPNVQRGDNRAVLLVEDNDSLRSTLARVLRRAGYQVLMASTGVAALEVWREHRDRISVLVTDQVMPGALTGSQLAAELLAERPNLAVITMSGYDLSQPGGKPLEDPRCTFLSKPFEPAALTGHIAALLGRG